MDTETIVILKENENITLHELCAEFVVVICDYVELNRHLQEINQLFEVFQFNLERLSDSYVIQKNDCVVRKDTLQSSYSDFIAINAYVTSIISAGRSLVDAVDNCAKESFGQESESYREFSANCKQSVYEKNFSYRLFYDLRNFSQHNHLPVSVRDSFCCFDTGQILGTPHFKSNKNVREELERIQKEIIELRRDNFRISLSYCLAQYVAGVAEVHRGFWERIKDLLFEQKHQIDAAIAEEPELLEHNNAKFDGCIIYQEPDTEEWQAFAPYSDTYTYYEDCINAAQEFFKQSEEKYLSLDAAFQKLSSR